MNRLCRLCERECKQSDTVLIIECRRYCPAPVQIEFKFKKSPNGTGRKKGAHS